MSQVLDMTESKLSAPRVRFRKFFNDAMINRLLSFGGAMIFLIAWQIASDSGYVQALFFSSPLAVLDTGWHMILSGELGGHLLASGSLFLVGFGLSIALALPLGIVLGWYRRAAAVADPFVSVLYVTPRIAVLPLIFVWVGVGFSAQVLIVVLMAFFPLLINTMAGVRSIDPQLLRVARSFMASDLAVFRTIALPASVPHIFSGLRNSMSMALTGVVVAEFFMGNSGIGSMMFRAGSTLDADRVFVGVVAIGFFALIFTYLMEQLDRYISRWRSPNS